MSSGANGKAKAAASGSKSSPAITSFFRTKSKAAGGSDADAVDLTGSDHVSDSAKTSTSTSTKTSTKTSMEIATSPQTKSSARTATSSSGDGSNNSSSSSSKSSSKSSVANKRKAPETHSFFKPRKKVAATTTSEAARDPQIIVAWNANGLANRLKYNADAIAAFLARESPDVLFVSETKLRASSQQKRNELCMRDKRSIDEATVLRTACETGCLSTHSVVKLSLCDRRYAGTAMFVRKSGPRPVRIWFGLPDPETMEKVPHNEDGRIILLEWKSIMTLHTYTPNNGWTVESFARRRTWDEKLTRWLRAMHNHKERKPIIYMGDMNVAPEDCDVSDPDWFNAQGDPPASGDPADIGQAGCTNNEQLRFKHMAEEGNLTDAFRYLEVKSAITRPTEVDAPIYTWRGHPGIDRPEAGRFYKKGMRIDHFLVSRSLLERVRRADICGRGLSAQDPSFLGSDHCPILLELLPSKD
ncbi:DNA-apurinic or apyrimidinic site lyase [Hondaea fermentalgiana]|uniref:DNA-(apurinic or apyrimidinic site) endonuclease n=1 Tax=Hondaea fermentalgiana TaxID=2315210 RepID=A0A2R5GID3_9STRA|nr:DNA-apurinic or apyrimidinic site lyase [Hondaea fermentalgiana]|eukprot:GBG30656.1 DNA-apurinic or apyrimidinic site lyase [Hondaea fermentalgiana]